SASSCSASSSAVTVGSLPVELGPFHSMSWPCNWRSNSSCCGLVSAPANFLCSCVSKPSICAFAMPGPSVGCRGCHGVREPESGSIGASLLRAMCLIQNRGIVRLQLQIAAKRQVFAGLRDVGVDVSLFLLHEARDCPCEIRMPDPVRRP